MRILVTGFDPFGQENVNPAWEAVRLLPGVVSGAEILKLEIPTVFGTCDQVVREAVLKGRPDAVLSI
ncbi:MAG TPA: peptidase C15, partial [Candidatus Cryosericum sp.]|nr:peptidase C15 [Candidatus Cryosericum sp.]